VRRLWSAWHNIRLCREECVVVDLAHVPMSAQLLADAVADAYAVGEQLI
jgi:hypothetical protein